MEGFYKTARWRRLRKFQLIQHPLCKFCLERGIVAAANVVDHVVPHRGDWTTFLTGSCRVWGQRSATGIGLDPIIPHPQAYEPCDEYELRYECD